MASNMPCMVSASTGPPPGAPQPGWRPNSAVGTNTGAIPSRARARAWAPPPTRLAATKLERIRTVVMAAGAGQTPVSWRSA